MSVNLATKKFLSYDGLNKFWELIKSKFVASAELSNDSGVTFKYADGTDAFNIPIATSGDDGSAGLMSKEQAATVAAFSEGVAAVVPLTAVKVNNIATTLTDRAVNIDLIYDSANKKIQLIDLNNKNAVLTSIDVSDFIKDGMVSEVNYADGKITIVFNTDAGQDAIVVDVSDLVDTYTAGNGITISDNIISVKIKDGEKYLAVDKNGLATTEQLVTDYTAAATTAGDSALAAAKTYTAEEIAKLTNEETGILASAKTYTDTAIDTAKAEINATIEENEKTTAEALTNLDGRVKTLEAFNHSVYATKDDLAVVDNKIGTLPEGTTTVVDYVDTQIEAANSYADTQATAAYTAMTAITDDEIERLINGATEE